MSGKHKIYILAGAMATVALGSIMVHDHLTTSVNPGHPTVESPEPKVLPTPKETIKAKTNPVPNPKPEPETAKPPESSPKKAVAQRTPPTAAQKKTPPKLSREEQIRAARLRYWKRAAAHFSKQQERLDEEQNEARRKNLIRSMAAYVRTDTPRAIEWAMSLTDPTEQRLALESINKYALTGIGVRIEKDDTGFPRIRETTVLSAADATGMVESGDYIIGIEGSEGQPISFDGMPMQEIVKYLRGEAGTEVSLIMERLTESGNEALRYHVPVQRSLLVIQPPF